MITIYGIKNCDTCRKARKWLDAEGIGNRFHDVRADGLETATLAAWIAALGWERLLNRRGTTWRKLAPEDREDIDEAAAAALLRAHPTLIKRPVFDLGGTFMVGFGDAERDRINSGGRD